MEIREEYILYLIIILGVTIALLLFEVCVTISLLRRIKRMNQDILQIRNTVKNYIETVFEEEDRQIREEKNDWQNQVISSVLQEYFT